VELFKVVNLLANTCKFNRFSRYSKYGKRRTASGIAVELRENYTRYIEKFVKALCDIYSILTCHGVNDKQYLVRLNFLFNVLKLVHELFVYMQTTRSIENNNVISVVFRKFYTFACNFYGVLLPHFKDLNACLFADDFQLVNSSRSVNIAGNKQRTPVHALEILCKLSGMRRFTRTLKSAHHNDAGRFWGKFNSGIGFTHQLAEFIVNNVDNLLSGSKTFHDLWTYSTVGHALHKILNYLVAYVGFEQRHFYFAHCFVYRFFVQFSVSAKVFENLSELFR